MTRDDFTVAQGPNGSWHWRCHDCGWVGMDCPDAQFAEREAVGHPCPEHGFRVSNEGMPSQCDDPSNCDQDEGCWCRQSLQGAFGKPESCSECRAKGWVLNDPTCRGCQRITKGRLSLTERHGYANRGGVTASEPGVPRLEGRLMPSEDTEPTLAQFEARGGPNYTQPVVNREANEPVNALQPAATTLIKLGSLAVHVEEMLSPGGHALDKSAIEGLLADEEVRTWLEAMDDMAFLPVKR